MVVARAEVIDRGAIWSTPAVRPPLFGPHPVPRRSEEGRVIDQVEHIIETAAWIGHRPTVQFGLHPKYPRPRLRGVHRPRDTGIHQCVSFPVSITCDPAEPLPQVTGFPGLGVLRALRPAPARSTGHAFTPTDPPLATAAVREEPEQFPQ